LPFLAAEAINAYLDVNERRMASIRQAISSLDRGEGIAQEQVKNWVSLMGRLQGAADPEAGGFLKGHAKSGVPAKPSIRAQSPKNHPRISLLLGKIRLYTAPSHTETWLKRPSGGSRAEKARLLTRFRRNQPEN
jgi:hypothetical protein